MQGVRGGPVREREREKERERARNIKFSLFAQARVRELLFFFFRQVLRRLVQRSAPTALPGSSLVRQSRRATSAPTAPPASTLRPPARLWFLHASTAPLASTSQVQVLKVCQCEGEKGGRGVWETKGARSREVKKECNIQRCKHTCIYIHALHDIFTHGVVAS